MAAIGGRRQGAGGFFGGRLSIVCVGGIVFLVFRRPCLFRASLPPAKIKTASTLPPPPRAPLRARGFSISIPRRHISFYRVAVSAVGRGAPVKSALRGARFFRHRRRRRHTPLVLVAATASHRPPRLRFNGSRPFPFPFPFPCPSPFPGAPNDRPTCCRFRVRCRAPVCARVRCRVYCRTDPITTRLTTRLTTHLTTHAIALPIGNRNVSTTQRATQSAAQRAAHLYIIIII